MIKGYFDGQYNVYIDLFMMVTSDADDNNVFYSNYWNQLLKQMMKIISLSLVTVW